MEVGGYLRVGSGDWRSGGCYLRAGAGERGEDAGVDEPELGLDLVAAQVVDRLTVLIQNQVFSVRPEPKTVDTWSSWCLSGGTPAHRVVIYWDHSRASDLSRGHPKWPDTAQLLLRAQFKAFGKPGIVPGLGTREHGDEGRKGRW